MSAKRLDESKNAEVVQLSDAYIADQAQAKIRIAEEHYANLAWISIGQRDVFIDFFRAPGIIEDDVPVLSGVRIYMPKAAAMRLSEVLNHLIVEAENTGEMEEI